MDGQMSLPIEPEAAEILHFQDMLTFVLEKDSGLTRKRARSLASHFADIQEFLDAQPNNLVRIASISGKRVLPLTEGQLQNVISLQQSQYLNPEESVNENYIAAISRDFTRKQVSMLAAMSLDSLNPNPFLIQSLDLSSPDKVVKLNVYMASTRSIVTSMGFFIEKLLESTSENVIKLEKEWDLLKTTPDGIKHWLQVKSGPNDMDYDQVVGVWVEKLAKKIKEGDFAYIATTYGKRDQLTISLKLLESYIPDWEMRTLIGKELWDFLSEDPLYHIKLFTTLRKAACQILGTKSIIDHIEVCISRITTEFIGRYGEDEGGVAAYLDEIF